MNFSQLPKINLSGTVKTPRFVCKKENVVRKTGSREKGVKKGESEEQSDKSLV